jgi:hypothetical protein
MFGSGLGLGYDVAEGRVSGDAWVWHSLRGGDPIVHGSGTGLQPGTAQGVESAAEWSSGSVGLPGEDLVNKLFFYQIVVWRSLALSKGLECHIFGSPWCLTSGVSPASR